MTKEVRIAIACGAHEEIKEVVQAVHQMVDVPVHFTVFDSGEDIADPSLWEFISCQDEAESVQKAVAYVANQEADILLKGIVQTHTLLKEVLKKDYQLKAQALLSHVSFVKLPGLDRPILLTDAAMNISPSPEQLEMIVENVIGVAHKIGMARPKVALISSAENYNPKMPSSVLATEVMQAFKDRADALVFGPISLDLALSKEAVAHKNYQGPIAGDADVLVVPTIDVGNVFYKTCLLFTGATMGGTIVGTKVPIVLTSRADAVASKCEAIAFAIKQVMGG